MKGQKVNRDIYRSYNMQRNNGEYTGNIEPRKEEDKKRIQGHNGICNKGTEEWW
jgi:hypothetical protein